MAKHNKTATNVARVEMTMGEIRAAVKANRESGRSTYDGLESREIGRYNRAIMFGDNDEAFPSQDEWSRVVD
jgi:hypothetical protein